MKTNFLTISSIEAKGGILTLSDGRRYLVLREHQTTSSTWPIGHSVQVFAGDHTQDGYTICSVELPEQHVQAVVR